MNSESEPAQVVDAILGGSVAPKALDLLARMIEDGDAAQLLSVLVSRCRASSKSEEEAVSQSMLKLEQLARSSRPLACMMMVHLLPIASGLMMHDVFDAIGLWISDCKSEKLTEYLKLMARSSDDPDMKRHYEWLFQARAHD